MTSELFPRTPCIATDRLDSYYMMVDEPLIKAATAIKTKKVNLGLGSAGGLPVIAIGKLGGKIVGYTAAGKPIYAGSSQANKLASAKMAKMAAKDVSEADIIAWLKALGMKAKTDKGYIAVPYAAGDMLVKQFGLVGKVSGKALIFQVSTLAQHIGKPLTPKEDEQLTYAAQMAAGDDEGVFPDPDKLKFVKQVKSGQHEVRYYQDDKGKGWYFKYKDPTIARAEEAAGRLGRLIVGNLMPAVKMVELAGEPGVIIAEVPGKVFNATSHSNPPSELLQKYTKEVAMHHVVDWLISNHDGHAGNFLDDGKKMYAIDKGQAWKFFGEDSLTANYSPNPSDPIYVKFWNAVKDGTLSVKEAKAGLEKAIGIASKISPEQFKSIVSPYIATAAAHMGFDAETRMNQMLARLENLEDAFVKFVFDLTGEILDVKEPGEENFETMPVVTEQAAGWPMTKGKITIHHPGGPLPVDVPAVWPKGYPGPGFKAQMTYKKKSYGVEFKAGPLGQIQVIMTYPDGMTKEWDSPAKASDSMKLWSDGYWSLDMNATEKKKKGIAYPASTAFGLKAFKKELAAATTGEIPEEAMSVQELEKEKKVSPEAKELSIFEKLKNTPNGPVSLLSLLPTDLKEFIDAQKKEVPSDWPATLTPGLAVKLSSSLGNPYFVTAAISQGGAPEYYLWIKPNEKWEQFGPLPHHTQDANIQQQVEFPDNEDILSWKEQHLLPAAAPPPSSPPAAEFTGEQEQKVTIPENAPAHSPGPLPDGASIIVKKKFPWGKKEVLLSVMTTTTTGEPVFSVGFPDEEGKIEAKDFKSLSAASDWVWVNQKGYAPERWRLEVLGHQAR
jgi:hypothetical protein